MPDITLRAYLNEIEDLIDHAQLDEAIAHCRHILSYYPKHIDSYRLLGKALLEQDRHSDAVDIFQRVLSAVPDDFVSHVGMAIIREDESNLDGAIWHMERAFEVQPSNGAIQEELRRLYGRRDGLEPEKIRLTRSALARTYAKGELYQQAIIELQKSLAEEPERLDLRVLYAQALWHTNQKAEAAETCAAILEKLPYCREANRILADIWLSSGRPEEASIYRKRVEALDPYEAFADRSHNGTAVAAVPAHSIRIPKLEWTPTTPGGRPAEKTPDWMTALGVSFEQPQPVQEQLPDWLSESAQAVGGPSPTTGDMPDWLRELGAVAPQQPAAASAGAGEDRLASLRSTSTASPALTATDWLGGTEPPTTAEPAGAETLDWLAGLEVGMAEEAADTGLPTPPSPPAEVPNWLAGLDVGAETTPPAGTAEVTPDWLAGLGAPSQPEPEATIPHFRAAQPAQPEPSSAAPEDRLPEWLRPPAEEEPAAPSAAVPDWLKGTEETGQPSPAEVPEWLRAPSADEEAPAVGLERADLPDWIRALAPQTPGTPTPPTPPPPAKAATPAREPEPQPAPDLPEWLRPPTEPVAPPPAASAPAFVNVPAEDLGPSDLPEWLKPLVEESAPASAASADDWLAQLSSREEQPPLEVKAAAVSGPPPFLAEEMTPSPAPAEPEIEKPAPPAPAVPPILETEDETMAWLEALAAKQGAKEEEMITPPEKRPGQLPKWLQAEPVEQPAQAEPTLSPPPQMPEWMAAAERGEPASTAAPEPVPPAAASAPERLESAEPAAAAPMAAEELPEWLKAVEPPAPTPAGELPSWLKDVEPPAEIEAAAPAPVEEMPAWLHGIQEPAPAAEEPVEPAAESPPEPIYEPVTFTPVALPAEEIPEWLKPPEAASVPPPTPPAPPLGSEDETLAWLESLAAKHGAKEEEMVTRPEERTERPPAWLEEIPQSPSPIEAAAPPTEEMPGWLSEATQPPEPGIPETPPSEMPAWLKAGLEAEEEPAKTPPSDLPQWLQFEAEPEPAAPTERLPVVPAFFEEGAGAFELPAPDRGAKEEQPPAPPKKDTSFLPTWEEVTGPAAPATQTAMHPAETWPSDVWPPEAGEPPTPPIVPVAPPVETPPAPQFVAPAPAVVPLVETAAPPPARPKLRPAKPRRKPRAPAEPPELRLTGARMRLQENNLDEALELYESLIKSNEQVDQVIADLETAAERDPENKKLLRTLGDAYMRDNRLQKALDTYRLALGQF